MILFKSMTKKTTQDKSTLDILFEDNHLLAIIKPFNMLTQTDKTKENSLLEIAKQYIKNKYNKPGNVYLGLLHRLDRPVSGIVLFAKTSKAASRLSKQFRERNIQKKYLAIVEGKMKVGESRTLRNYLCKNTKTNKVTIYNQPHPNSRIAILKFTVLNNHNTKYEKIFCKSNIYNKKDISILNIDLKTGLSHQIRAQLSNIGHPILGDIKYHATQSLSQKNIALLANQLTFFHPTTQQKLSLKIPI